MTSSIKLPEDEHTLLVSLQNRFNELTVRYGELHYQKKSLEAELKMVDAAFDELEAERFNAVNKMQEKYGVGRVSLVTGEFTPDESLTSTDTP